MTVTYLMLTVAPVPGVGGVGVALRGRVGVDVGVCARVRACVCVRRPRQQQRQPTDAVQPSVVGASGRPPSPYVAQTGATPQTAAPPWLGLQHKPLVL